MVGKSEEQFRTGWDSGLEVSSSALSRAELSERTSRTVFLCVVTSVSPIASVPGVRNHRND